MALDHKITQLVHSVMSSISTRRTRIKCKNKVIHQLLNGRYEITLITLEDKEVLADDPTSLYDSVTSLIESEVAIQISIICDIEDLLLPKVPPSVKPEEKKRNLPLKIHILRNLLSNLMQTLSLSLPKKHLWTIDLSHLKIVRNQLKY